VDAAPAKHEQPSYNYARDYDPVVGRYVESDPIGLAAGVNSFAYANGDPLRYGDQFGLDAESAKGPPPTTLPTPYRPPQPVPQPKPPGELPSNPAWGLLGRCLTGVGLALYPSSISECQDRFRPPGANCPPNEDCKDRLSDFQIRQRGLDPHEIKRAILRRTAPISRFELCQCKDGRVVIREKGCTGPIIETGETM